jgi:hypothetical protein
VASAIQIDAKIYGTDKPTVLKNGSPAVLEPPPGQRGGFWPGRPRSVGSGTKVGIKLRRNTLHDVCRRISEETGVECDPVIAMMKIIAGRDEAMEKHAERMGVKIEYDADKKSWIDAEGNIHMCGLVGLDRRIDCMKALAPYLHARLSNTTVSVNDGNEQAGIRAKAMENAQKDPKLREAMEQVEMQMAAAVANAVIEEDLADG